MYRFHKNIVVFVKFRYVYPESIAVDFMSQRCDKCYIFYLNFTKISQKYHIFVNYSDFLNFPEICILETEKIQVGLVTFFQLLLGKLVCAALGLLLSKDRFPYL